MNIQKIKRPSSFTSVLVMDFDWFYISKCCGVDNIYHLSPTEFFICSKLEDLFFKYPGDITKITEKDFFKLILEFGGIEYFKKFILSVHEAGKEKGKEELKKEFRKLMF